MRLNREILRLALPSILANITVPLVGMVDIAVVGHLGADGGMSAAAFIGGISVGTMLFDLLYWNFAFLRSGTGGLTAQAYGRAPADAPLSQHTEALNELSGILGRALRIALLSGVALIALQWVVVQLAFLVVDCSPEVRQLATRYFYIRIWAAPASLSLFAFKGWFIGLQDSLRPMLADLWVNLCNILLSVGLGFGLVVGGGSLAGSTAQGAGITLLPRLGFTGVAWGTVIAQWTGFFLCLFMIRKYLKLSDLLKILCSFCAEDFKQNTEDQAVTRHRKLNLNLYIRSVAMIAVYIGFTMLAARMGEMMLAVSAILMKLLMLFSYFTDGFAYAGEALTGRFIGERSEEGVRAAVRCTFAWSLALAVAFILLYGLGGVPLLRLMTSDAAVVDAGRPFLPWLLLMPLIGCPAFAWDGIYIGATASGDLRRSTVLCAIGFFAVYLAGCPLTGSPEQMLHLLMGAYFTHLAIRALYLSVRYRNAILRVHFPARPTLPHNLA